MSPNCSTQFRVSGSLGYQIFVECCETEWSGEEKKLVTVPAYSDLVTKYG